jgi:mono/diheme cytochrome c family protein
MNILVVGPVLLILLALRLLPIRVNMLGWFFAWLAGIYTILRFGFQVPIPASVVKLYMGIVVLALLAYATSSRERLRELWHPLRAFLTERRFVPLLALVALAIPAAVMAGIYLDLTAEPVPPAFGRTVHPAPPDRITVHDEPVNLVTVTNPYRRLEETDPEAFAEHVAEGRRIYYENCFYCHGDVMRGEGMFAHGLNPIPTNFQDPGTIAQLQESFLFWRISKGGPGLPQEGGPWDSAMPAWEKFLSEEEMWDVILFLYDFTGHSPRARHETTEGGE